MKTNIEIKSGDKIQSRGMVMVVTGENKTHYTGYNEYKGRNVGDCQLSKSMFSNPHYMNDIKILSNGETN